MFSEKSDASCRPCCHHQFKMEAYWEIAACSKAVICSKAQTLIRNNCTRNTASHGSGSVWGALPKLHCLKRMKLLSRQAHTIHRATDELCLIQDPQWSTGKTSQGSGRLNGDDVTRGKASARGTGDRALSVQAAGLCPAQVCNGHESTSRWLSTSSEKWLGAGLKQWLGGQVLTGSLSWEVRD